MELIQGKCEASKSEPKDFISNMPDNVVTNIMDRLPMRDAVRTGILSRNWRSKWTMLSQLVFDLNFFDFLEDAKDIGKIISRILLHTRGVITKFVFSIEEASCSVEEEISHWVFFLSTKGIKDLTLERTLGQPFKLPFHLFSCLTLKRMELMNCCFDPPAGFQGFPNLLTLDLYDVHFEKGNFVKLITQRPILENLNVRRGYWSSMSKVRLDEIGKLANLKRLSLFLCMVDKTSSSSILELVGFLPKLEELRLDFITCKITEEGVAAKRCPTTFPCLKTLNLSSLDISNGIGFSHALQMISSSPNLQTLEIKSCYRRDVPQPEICSPDEDYNTRGLLQLRSVVLMYLTASQNEVCLIKYLLACSPFLKKVRIRLLDRVASNQKYMFAIKLLKLHRASSEVDIDLY